MSEFLQFAQASEAGSAAGYVMRARAGGATGEIEFVAVHDPINGASAQYSISADRWKFIGKHADFFSDVTISGTLIVDGTVGAVQIADGAIIANKLAVDSVVTANIVTANITTETINGDAVNNTDFYVGTVNQSVNGGSAYQTKASIPFTKEAGYETVIIASFEAISINDGSTQATVRLQRDTTDIETAGVVINDEIKTVQFIDTSTTGGSVTYKLQFNDFQTDGWTVGPPIVQVIQRKR